MSDTNHQYLHKLEDGIIEMSALISVIQKLDNDVESFPVLLNVLEGVK